MRILASSKNTKVVGKKKKKKKSPPFSPYYGVRFQFVQRCKHVNVILSSRNVRKSRHYAILDAQRIFNGRVKNIHWVHVARAQRTIFHFSRCWYACRLRAYTGNILYVCVRVCIHVQIDVCKYVDFEFGPADISIGERYRTTLFFG